MEPRPGEDRPYLPPPTLWPVGFAVGIVCLLVGLIVSWPVAAVGAGITAIFGFLWVRDVTAAQRRHEAAVPSADASGGPESATDAPPLPADQGEAAMPEPEPGERFPRSVFLEGATLGLGAVIGGLVTVPALGFMVLPAFTKQGSKDVDIGSIDDFDEGQFYVATFLRDPAIGEVSRRTAYVRNNGLVKGLPSFTVLSNRCVHLGCPVQPNGPLFDNKKKTEKVHKNEITLTPTLPAGGFGCPCHGGQYDPEGNRTAGPPVRALDRYEFFIRDGRVVLGRTYSVAKVNGTGGSAKIKKYHLAGPGEHVDGPESWLYPIQPPH
ncbi:MAG: Rieske 2Fe-2S domain-containing protein [Actinomycetota bacterium]|nr:Rieske 2Fe-2S domain-containing protein [Actinomycetota bacterium]